MQSRKIRKRIAVAAVAGAVVLTMSASLAYFTDRAATSADGTAGTVAITLDDADLQASAALDGNQAGSLKIMDPGDKFDVSFGVHNEGNKSVDIRETIVLSAYDKDGNAIALTDSVNEASGQAQFDIYRASDVEPNVPSGVSVAADAAEKTAQGEKYGWKPKAGAKPVAVRSHTAGSNQITYRLGDDGDAEITLDGNSSAAIRESGDAATDFQNTYATLNNAKDGIDNDFVLIFRGDSSNDFQDSSIVLNYTVEAKQARNTDAGWTVVAQSSVNLGDGNNTPKNVNAVPEESVLTDSNGDLVTP